MKRVRNLTEDEIKSINKRFKKRRRFQMLKNSIRLQRKSIKLFVKFVLGKKISKWIWDEPYYF